ncbi:autotransporter domain-containing protein [Pseudomonas fluorescens]|uniref:autotransporter domain-containing protein n=1 Tax=Pseudomonas fluorescens TaxID=294 RepID=UPI00064205FD|nr:autotransporter domain-containing protein [Pseudomonas fluorescens]
MRTPLTAPGNWLTRPLISLFLLLVMLTMSSQAMAVAPVITNPASGSTLPTIAVGQSMSITISSVGGTMPLNKWVECDANDPDYDGVTPCLPPGLILDASPGSATTVLHGTPTAAGNYTFSITLNDGHNDGGVATYNLLVTSSSTPTLTSVAPSSGSTAGATAVTLTGTNFTGATAVTFGGVAATGFTVNNATTITATTPAHAAGPVNVAVTTPGGSTTLTNSYTYAVPAPTVGPVSATVAANSNANPITLSLSGGAATSVAVASPASHGTATASGTSITYTPAAGFSGSDSFTYTATNTSGTSSPATVTITVTPPTLAITPPTLPDGTQGTSYSQSVSASGGTTPYTYAITAGSLPTGLSLNTSSGVISGTPSGTGTFNLTVTATDANSATGSRAYSLVINGLAPVANAVSATVAANSSANPITLNITGGAAASVAVASAASHGTATASGTSITYTPTAGFSGSDSFTYTATNASGTSSPATVTITVSAPSISLSPGSLSNGTVGTAYSASLSASGGAAPYSYTITAGTLPTGLSLSTSSGAISGTPSASGTFNMTVTATDANSATGSQAYSITIGALAPVAGAVSATVAANSSANPITLNISGGAATSVAVASAASHGTATASGTSITYTPTAGFSGSDSFTYTATNAGGTSSPATVTITVSAPTLVLTPASLGAGTAGSAYSATLSTTGGSAPYTYSISSGSLPAGLSLNTASGLISGTPSTSGTSNLTITATDANGATGSQAYSITIAAVAITVPATSQILAAGQSATVDLTQGATGGPFTQAVLGSVTPASAGRAMMISRFSMRFVPSAAFAGTAVVSFSLQNGGGASAASTVSFMIQERPDPTKDAEVIGLLNAQTRAAERFASTQMDNFNRRLEQLHQMSCERNSFNASLRKEGRDVPLGEIAKAVQDQLGGSANQTAEEKREAAAALQDNCKQDALAFWSDGFVNVGSTHTRGARDNSFTTLGLSVGVDYRLSPTAIAGVGIGYGNDRSDIGKNHTRSDGDAIGIATYLSLNLAPQVYVDGLLGYNRISFDSRRYITGSNDDYARGSRDADQLFASLTASYEYRQGPLSLTPYGRLNASSTRLDAYRENGGGIYALSYDEQRQQNLTSYLGVRSGYDLMTRIGVVTPKVGLAWGHNFSSSSDYKMRYADQGDEGTLYRLKPDALDSDFASLDMGVDFNLGRAWQLGVSYKTALGSDERNDTFRLGLNGKF